MTSVRDPVAGERLVTLGEPLSFRWLHQQVLRFKQQTKATGPSTWEKKAWWVVLLGLSLGLCVAALTPTFIVPNVARWLSMAALVAEGVGIAVVFVLTLRREVPNWRRFRATHAEEMDQEFELWRELVAEVSRFPSTQREQMLSFARRLNDGMSYRMGMAFGGVERLGVFPVLVALYLQFRDWEFGDWVAAFEVHVVGGLILWCIVLFYVMGWALVGLRIRLSTYIDLLDESLRGLPGEAPLEAAPDARRHGRQGGRYSPDGHAPGAAP